MHRLNPQMPEMTPARRRQLGEALQQDMTNAGVAPEKGISAKDSTMSAPKPLSSVQKLPWRAYSRAPWASWMPRGGSS